MFMFAICRRPSVCLSSACLSSVTFVHPTQAIEIFGKKFIVVETFTQWNAVTNALLAKVHFDDCSSELSGCRTTTTLDVGTSIVTGGRLHMSCTTLIDKTSATTEIARSENCVNALATFMTLAPL